MASTIFFAASSKFSADINFKPELSKISFPSLKFVPASLTTKGTLIFISLAASTTPCARYKKYKKENSDLLDEEYFPLLWKNKSI